ncbi:MAG: hypothetical protein JWP87_6519 [Labilithrix sp.]|nr:hypothetical protein [Labilithrix sp.]
MSREDSGVIDLFAMHKKATESAAQSVAPPDIFSAPPPAFSTDLAGDRLSDVDVGDAENPFAQKPRKNLYIAGGIAGGLLFVGILIASFTGGSAEPAKASASGRSEPVTVAAPPATPPPPAPVVIAPAVPAEIASAKVPPPPTTGSSILSKPPVKGGAVRAAAPAKPRVNTTAGGVKLTKVQSAGVP